MPRYDHKSIEPKWQNHWEENKTFQVSDDLNALHAAGKDKLYVLDMFPYPSGDGLHVGHPEGYTATDIVCRYNRLLGKNVLHPMGWDAFGLPAEQHAVKTGTHPRITTYNNIDTFRRQLKMLGFSYDWSREFSTTDPDYLRWTQWIFLQIFDSWYDPDYEWTGPDGKTREGKGRPISELPIPDGVKSQGDEAVRRFQDKHRLGYQHEAPVNWCPELRTVLSNEEIIDGKSERGGYPVIRIPLRQWMLRITAYADRLLEDLDDVDWPESVKSLQRNWIGRSEGAEVDFYIGTDKASSRRQPADDSRQSTTPEDQGADAPRSPNSFQEWKTERSQSGYPAEPGDDVLRVYTTRPDTLFGATYMVLAPEHPFVDRLTTPEQKEAVAQYRQQASMKSDLDRTDLAKEKTGVFSGSYAVNPVNGEQIPIWIADYVLISYGTGAIMAVPAHDERDFEFAKEFDLPIRAVVEPPQEWLEAHSIFRTSKDIEWGAEQSAKYEQMIEQYRQEGARSGPIRQLQELRQLALNSVEHSKNLAKKLTKIYRDNSAVPTLFDFAYSGLGIAINSGDYNGLTTENFKQKITADFAACGLAKQAVNFRLRDWLFSRQHFWGEPFPIWHELDADGNPTGLMRTVLESELPVKLPEDFDFKPHGRPEPPLDEAPENWLYKTDADGIRLKRETNSMPQWAGSCWYFLRFCDPKNSDRFIDPEKEKYWLPVDLYIGGAEHAVLHLLYSRFWHKVLFDRGHVSTCEPFQKLVNQGMILGEAELTGYKNAADEWVSAKSVDSEDTLMTAVKLNTDQVEKRGEDVVLKDDPSIVVDSRAYKMSKSRGNVINPDYVVEQYGADALRLYEMFMGPLEQMKPWSMSGVEGVSRFLGRVWRMVIDERADAVTLNSAIQNIEPNDDQLRILHKTIKAVTEDIEKLSFNTAISRMMEFTNVIVGQDPRPQSVLEPFILLLSPFAPHIAEELWQVLGHDGSLAYEPWPKYDDALIAESEIEIPVQVNGKLRSKVKVPAEADQQTIQQAAESDEVVAKHLTGKTVVKVIVVPGRLVNFVVKG